MNREICFITQQVTLEEIHTILVNHKDDILLFDFSSSVLLVFLFIFLLVLMFDVRCSMFDVRCSMFDV